MAFYTAFITTFFLCLIVDIQAHITTHTVYGQNAQRCYVQFLTLYSNHADRYIKGLPMQGSQLQVLKAMIYVHCMKSIDPQSIHQLLKNYSVLTHEKSWQCLFIQMLSKIPMNEQHQIYKTIISVNEKGMIQEIEFQSRNKSNGILKIDKPYVLNASLTLQMPGLKIRGGVR